MAVIELSQFPEGFDRDLLSDIDNAIMERKDWADALLVARNLYYGNSKRLDAHWEDGSDIHLPVVFEKVESMVPKLHNAFFNIEPKVVVRRVPEEMDREDTLIQEQFINWALDYDVPDFFITTISWFRNMLIDGVGVLKTRWEHKWRNTCEIHNVKSVIPRGGNAQGFTLDFERTKTVDELMAEIFKGAIVLRLEQLSDTVYELDIVENRRRIPVIRVELLPSDFVDEIVARVFRPVLVADNPSVEVVEAEDLIVPYRTRNLQKSDWVAHQHYMTVDEMVAQTDPANSSDPWTLSEQDITNLGAAASSEAYKVDPQNDASQRAKDEMTGITSNRGRQGHSKVNNRLPLYEVYASYDIDQDGRREEIVLQVSPNLKKIVHATFLDTVHPHGHRPFSTIHFLAPTDRFYTPGIAEILAPINIQVNTTMNQINDAQELQNNPFGFYEPAGFTADEETLQCIPPGTLIPTNDTSSVVFPTWGSQPLANMNVIDSVLLFADRVSVSPFSGGNTQVRNAPRTARGTLALISEGNIKTDLLVAMAQREGWTELMYQITGLYREFLTDEKHFWATGRDRKRYADLIAPKHLKGKFEFTFSGNTTNTNPEVQRTLSQLRYQVAATNPLYVNSPLRFRELLRDFLLSHSEGTNVENLLPELPQSGVESHAPMNQKDELTILRMGRPVDILQSDNDPQHIDTIDRFMADPVATASMPQIAVGFIIEHRRRHIVQMNQKMQMAAIQQNNSGGASAGGGEQSVALGNLEGGIQ